MLERDIQISPETLSVRETKRIIVRINNSEEVLPVFVSPTFEDNFSRFVNQEIEKFEIQLKNKNLSNDDRTKLDVLSGDLNAIINLKLDESENISYDIESFSDRKLLDWFQFLDNYPELALLCETDKAKYDTVFDFFSSRFDYVLKHAEGSDVNFLKMLDSFHEKLSLRIESGQITDEEVDNLSDYFAEISSRFTVV